MFMYLLRSLLVPRGSISLARIQSLFNFEAKTKFINLYFTHDKGATPKLNPSLSHLCGVRVIMEYIIKVNKGIDIKNRQNQNLEIFRFVLPKNL